MTTTGGKEFDDFDGDATEDPRDRVLDALLHEAVQGGGSSGVPDLTARVTARLQSGATSVDPGIVRLPRRRARVVPIVLGALVGAAAAAFFAIQLRSGRDEPRATRAVAWQVVEGCLQWQSRDAGETAHGGERALWPVDTGDRLRSCEENVAVCDVASLGRLHMSKATEIEVAAMEWKSFGGGTALGAVTVAVVAGAIRWSGGGEVAQAHTGEKLELRAQSPQLAAAKVDELTRRVDELQKELTDERARAREFEIKAARTAAANAAQVAANESLDKAEVKPLQHAVTYAGMEAALESIDWDLTGECMHKMTKKLDAVFAVLEKGEDMPLDMLGDVAKLNAELIKQTGDLMKAKIPGTGPNGVFTNPVVAANQLFATLTKAGLPLSDPQRDALQRLSAQIAGEDEQRRSKIADDEFELAGLIGETDLKDRFYKDARQLMTPQQEQALFPPRLAGTSGNLFDTGLVWAPFAKPVTVRDRGEFAEKLSESLARQAGLGEDMTPQVRAAVDAWAKALPDDAFGETDDRSEMGLGKLGPVRGAAVRQLALLRDLSRTLPLTAAQKAKLRKVGPVFMPRYSKK